MTVYFVKIGDVGSTIEETLLDKDGAGVNLTGGTVLFVMQQHGSTAVLGGTAVLVNGGTVGEVRYDWRAADLAVAGHYRGEWQVTYSGGAIETFPQDGYIGVVVRDDLN